MSSIVLLHSVLRGETGLATLLIGYLGPGGGISTIGSMLALLAAIVVALFGFVWFPLKRLLRSRKRQAPQAKQTDTAAPDSASQP